MATRQSQKPKSPKVIGTISKLAGALVGTAVVTGKRIVKKAAKPSEKTAGKSGKKSAGEPKKKSVHPPTRKKKKVMLHWMISTWKMLKGY